MLSTENPPPDLCEISQLESGDENKQQLEVDLLKSADLDYNNPLPNFSIRDYVFNTRTKDIKTNWPFSQKNLQLCLKHGAKDLLPPFQSLDSVRNSSVAEPVVDSLGNGENSQRPAVNIENIDSSECEEDPSTTSQSCSKINFVRSEPEAEYLLCDKPEFTVRESKRAESNIQSPAKKCRLIVKLNNIAEPRSDEYSAVNICVVSETMASKVCPVCKTFSSSSNTTLNAHIDQCLSVESTANWTENPKVIKHRIKPRKTRLMVDIYETALHSTLEDLDRRNGTNWASNMGLHPQDLDACAEEAYSPVEDINQEGAVYIDSSGTKLRILSKFSHLPPKLDTNDSGPCKFVKRDKGIKLLSNKKKKHLLQNNCLDGQGSCSPFPHGSKSCYSRVEVTDGQHKLYPPEGHKEDGPTKSPVASHHMKSDDFGMIKQWVGSKRTGLKKKINLELENQLPDKSLKNSRRSVSSSLSDRGNSALISPISSDESPVLPSDSLKRKENLSGSHDGQKELPCKRKEPGSSLLRSKHLSDKKVHLMSSRFNVKQSRKDTTSVHARPRDPPNRTASSRGNKKMGVISRATVKSDSSFIGSIMSHCHASPFEGKNATPLRKMPLGHARGGRRSKLLSVRHASGAELKKNLRRELLNFKKARFPCMLLSDEEADEDNLAKALGENATLMEKDSTELQTNRTKALEIREKIEGFVSSSEGDMTSKGSETSSESDCYKVGNKIDSFVGRSVPVDASSVFEEDAEMLDDFVLDPASTDGEAFVSFSKSLDSAFAGHADSNVERVSQYYSKAYDGHCPTDLAFHADQEMLCADNVGKKLVTHEMAEMNGSDEAQGNYFVDVDPIPIPGPPGSFLPSPERMGSEEILGHSSLTTCRVQSSDDGHEVVDMDSSDSSISAMSTVSNSFAGRSITNLLAQSHVQHKNQFDIPEKRINPAVDELIGNGERENLLKSKSHLMLPEVQPCCCSRKDVSLQGGSLNYQELQILRRRTMTSLSVLSPNDVDNGFGCYSFGAETLPEKEPTQVTKKDETDSPVAYPPVPVPHNSEALMLTPTSNPVLRLMGKNLMVVNKDEDNLPPKTQPIQSSMMIEHQSVRENGVSTRNKPTPFHHMISRGPSMFDSMQSQQQYDAFKIPTSHPSRPMFGDNATSGPKIKPDFQTSSGMEKVSTPRVHHLKTTYSSAGKHKEIIVIDDSSESEAGLAVRATHCSRDVEGREAVGHAASMLFPPDSRHVNHLYSYQMRVINPHFGGSPMIANRNSTISPPSNGLMNANLGKWTCIPEGSTALHSNSSSASSLPSSVHLRSKHFSPRFS